MQQQFGDREPLALQRGAQAAITQIHAVEQRAHAKLVGRELPAPTRRGARAGQARVGAQAAAHTPAGRRQRGPQAQVGQLGAHAGGQLGGLVLPGKARVGAAFFQGLVVFECGQAVREAGQGACHQRGVGLHTQQVFI